MQPQMVSDISGKVHKTHTYHTFTLWEFYTPLQKDYLQQLEQAILSENRLAENPIFVTTDHVIVNGKHRFLIARKHHLTLYYEVVGTHVISRDTAWQVFIRHVVGWCNWVCQRKVNDGFNYVTCCECARLLPLRPYSPHLHASPCLYFKRNKEYRTLLL